MSDYTEVNYSLKQVPCQKPVNGIQFAQGTQDFPFSIGAPNCWNPHRSYFKIDYQLIGVGTNAGSNPLVSDIIPMAYNFAGNLYTQVNCKFGEQDVSVINTFSPQASALKTRLRKSAAWLQNIGKSINYDSASQASRLYQGSGGGILANTGDGSTQFLLKGCTNNSIGNGVATVTPNADSTANTVNISISTGGVVTGHPVVIGPPRYGFAWTQASGSDGDTQLFEGDILVANGVQYTLLANPSADGTCQVTPSPAVAVVNTPNFYFMRQNWENTNIAKNVSSVLWQPPCGLFDCDEWIGSGQYRISLVPNSNFIQSVVQSPNPTYNTTNGWQFSVQAVYFYAYCAKASIPEGPRELPLIELAITPKAFNAPTLQYVVPPSTFAISVFLQNNTAGANTLWPPSSFKALSTVFANMSSGDLSVQTLQLTYASINKPDTNWNSNYNVTQSGLGLNAGQVGQLNQLVQRYFDTMLENKTEYSKGGAESLNEWMQNGPVFHFLFSRDVTDRSTEVNLNITAPFADPATTNVVVCAWYRNIVNYTVAQGLITAVASRPA